MAESKNGGGSQARTSLVAKLVMNWVRTKRPDVIEAAQAEAEKRFPHVPRARKIDMPASMKELK